MLLSFLVACKSKSDLTYSLPSELTTKDANIFILSGQSNALGQHLPDQAMINLPAHYKGVQTNILVWRHGNTDTSTALAGLEPMLVPVNTRDKIYNSASHPYTNITGWGVEQSWIHFAQSHFHQPVYLIKNAVGALSIKNWNAVNGPMFRELSSWILETRAELLRQKKHPIFRGFVWMQGEADIDNPDYYTELRDLASNIRNLCPETNGLPFIIIRIKPGTVAYSSGVDSAFSAFCKEDIVHNFMLDPQNVPGVTLGDNVHYDDVGKLLLGKAIFDFQKTRNQLND